MKILSLFVFCLMLAHCGTKDSKKDSSKKDQAAAKGEAAAQDGSAAEDGPGGTPAAQPSAAQNAPSTDAASSAAEFKAVRWTLGVYTAQADIHYDLLQRSVDVPVKVSINHNGNENNKKFIIRIERIGEPSEEEKIVEGDQGFLCSLYNDFTLQTIYKQIHSEDTQTAGKLGDANKILVRVASTGGQPFHVGLACTDRRICQFDYSFITDVEKTQNPPTFQSLYSSCFGG